MERKICTKCKQNLPLSEYHWRDKKRGIYRSECKRCHDDFMKEIYQQKRIAISEIKASLQCAKCGEKKSYKLDFHHSDPNIKDQNVSRLICGTYKLDRALEEIKKCTVLCANCHREFHHYNDNYGIELDDYLQNEYDFD